MGLDVLAAACAAALVGAPDVDLDWGVGSRNRLGWLHRRGYERSSFADLRVSPALQATVGSAGSTLRARYAPSLATRLDGLGRQSDRPGEDSRLMWINRGEVRGGLGEGRSRSLVVEGWITHGQIHRSAAQAGIEHPVDGADASDGQAWSGVPRNAVLNYHHAGGQATLRSRLQPDLNAELRGRFDRMNHGSGGPDDTLAPEEPPRFRMRRRLWEAQGSLTHTGRRRASLTLATSLTRVRFGGPEIYHGVMPSATYSLAATRRLTLSLHGGMMAIWQAGSPSSPDSPPRYIPAASASASGVLFRTRGQTLNGHIEAGVGPSLDALRGEPDTRAHLTLRLAYEPVGPFSAALSANLVTTADLVDGRLRSAPPAANGVDTDDCVGTLTAELGYRLSPSTTLSGGLQGHGRWDTPLVPRRRLPYRELAIFVALAVETDAAPRHPAQPRAAPPARGEGPQVPADAPRGG